MSPSIKQEPIKTERPGVQNEGPKTKFVDVLKILSDDEKKEERSKNGKPMFYKVVGRKEVKSEVIHLDAAASSSTTPVHTTTPSSSTNPLLDLNQPSIEGSQQPIS